MESTHLIQRLALFPDVLRSLIAGIDEADLRWRPLDNGWSILEILCHVADEETDDFRSRVRLTLEQPGAVWPAIDPEKAAIERDYQSQDANSVLSRFCRERTASIKWLKGLQDPDWSKTYEHPQWGMFRAGDVFASWVAHDALHLRQIARRLFQMTQRDAEEFDTRYAGEWKA